MRTSSWINISPKSCTDRCSSCWWASRSKSSSSCFSLRSTCKNKYTRFQREFLWLRLTSFLLVVVVLFVDQVRDQLVQSMRNSDPTSENCLFHIFNSNFHSVFTLQITGCDFQYGSNFGVSWIQPFGSVDSPSHGKVYHNMSMALQSVRTRQSVLSWSTVQPQLFPKILNQYKSGSIDLVVKAFPLILYFRKKSFLVQKLQSKVQVF